jgi:hypothetical protein
MSQSNSLFVILAGELGEYFGLVQGEDEARGVFEQLAIDTYKCIGGDSPIYRPNRDIFESDGKLSGELRARWRAWKHEYQCLLKRNPVLELYDMLENIGESHIFSPWPYGLTWDILDWVEKGDRYALPFDDRNDIATGEFYARLCEVRQLAKGWLDWDDAKKRVVFISNEKIERYRSRLLAAEKRSGTRIYGDAWESMRVKQQSAKAETIAERHSRLLAEEASRQS